MSNVVTESLVSVPTPGPAGKIVVDVTPQRNAPVESPPVADAPKEAAAAPQPAADASDAPAAESATPKPAEPAAPPPKVAATFAALARQEKATRARAAEVERKAAELAAREAKVKEYEQTREAAKLNPMAYLQAAGLTFDEIAQYQLQGGPTADAKLAALEAKLEAQAKAAEQREAARIEAEKARSSEAERSAVAALQKDITLHLTAADSRERYELLSALGDDAPREVYALISGWYQKNGEFLSIERAAGMLEDHLTKDLEAKVKASKKLSHLIAPPALPVPPAVSTTKPVSEPADAKPKTSTSTISRKAVAPPALVSSADAAMDFEAKRERSRRLAAAALKFK